MDKLIEALVPLQADNPLGLPIIRTLKEAVPLRGTNIRSGVFYVIPERQMRDYARMLWEHPRLSFLHKVRYNVLTAHLHNPPSPEPGRVLFPDKAVLVIYDYDNNLGYQIEADFPVPKRVEITPLKGQPDYFSEAEYHDAVQVLASDPKYGEPLRRGIAYCSPGMPPVITEAAPESLWGRLDAFPNYVPDHRMVSVLLHFRPGSGRESEVGHFLIDMTEGRCRRMARAGATSILRRAADRVQAVVQMSAAVRGRRLLGLRATLCGVCSCAVPAASNGDGQDLRLGRRADGCVL
jgi:hypothetical protein